MHQPLVLIPQQPSDKATRAAGVRDAAPDLPRGRGLAILTGLSSDAHTWNLVYLQLLMEELGWQVVNLGATTPDREIIGACRRYRPDLLVVSSVNGHGHIDGARLITALRDREELAGIPAVIGGKLGVAGEVGADRVVALLTAGFDAVFQDGTDVDSFTHYLSVLGNGRVAVTS